MRSRSSSRSPSGHGSGAFVGALIAVPLLVVIKVFCDHFDGLRHVGNFLSAQQVIEPEEAEPAAANKAAP